MNLLSVIAASRRRVSVFDPLSLTPALWLDASDADTLFDATSGGSTPTSGNDIARWEDKSGNDRHFTQPNDAKCPHYQTAVQNGLAVARFDGTDDVMGGNAAALNILRNKPGASAVACYRWIANPLTVQGIFNISVSSSNLARFVINAGGTARKSRTGGRRLDGDGFQSVNSAADNPTTCFTHAGVISYANRTARQYLNNSLDGTSDVFLTAGNTSDAASLSVALGASAPTVNHANIDLSEIFVFDRAISDADRNALHNYLTAKWGITL